MNFRPRREKMRLVSMYGKKVMPLSNETYRSQIRSIISEAGGRYDMSIPLCTNGRKQYRKFLITRKKIIQTGNGKRAFCKNKSRHRGS